MVISSWVVMYMQIKSFKHERKKVRHIALSLHCYYDYSVFPSIHIAFFKKSHFDIRYTDPKKENFTDLLYRAYLDTLDILRILPHMAKRKYNGCELLSPLYRKIEAEMARNKKKTVVINEYKPKRGKRS